MSVIYCLRFSCLVSSFTMLLFRFYLIIMSSSILLIIESAEDNEVTLKLLAFIFPKLWKFYLISSFWANFRFRSFITSFWWLILVYKLFSYSINNGNCFNILFLSYLNGIQAMSSLEDSARPVFGDVLEFLNHSSIADF